MAFRTQAGGVRWGWGAVGWRRNRTSPSLSEQVAGQNLVRSPKASLCGQEWGQGHRQGGPQTGLQASTAELASLPLWGWGAQGRQGGGPGHTMPFPDSRPEHSAAPLKGA